MSIGDRVDAAHAYNALSFLVYAEARESLHADREERLTDVEARKFLPLADKHSPAGPGEEGSCGAPSRSAANDGHVVD